MMNTLTVIIFVLVLVAIAVALALYTFPGLLNMIPRDRFVDLESGMGNPSDRLTSLRRRLTTKYDHAMDHVYAPPSDEEREAMLQKMRLDLEEDVKKTAEMGRGASPYMYAMPTTRGVCPEGYRHVHFNGSEMCLKLGQDEAVEVSPDFVFMGIVSPNRMDRQKEYYKVEIGGIKYMVDKQHPDL